MIITPQFTERTYKYPVSGVMFYAITNDRRCADGIWVSDEDTISTMEAKVRSIMEELAPYDKGAAQS